MISASRTGLKKHRMDWILFFSVLTLMVVGTLAISSSVSALPFQARILRTHFIAIPLGLIALAAVWSLNYQVFQDQWKFVYGDAAPCWACSLRRYG